MSSQIAMNRQSWGAVERVAWIRPGAIGDLIVGLAALEEMPMLFPRAKVTVIGPKQWLEVLSAQKFSFVERIAVVERKGLLARVMIAKDGAWAFDRESTIDEVLKSCGAVVNLNIDSLRYGFAALRARVPIRVGSTPALMSWVYTHTSPFFGKDPLVHERDGALLILEYATDSRSRFFQTTKTNRARLAKFLEESLLVKKWRALGLPNAKVLSSARAHEITQREPRSYVLANPTASRREKTWPTDRMFALLESMAPLLKEKNLEALVIGAPNETEWLNEVARGKYRVVQPKNLSDLQDVVAGARALLTNASSMQFIAGTTKTPTLTIFGRGQPVIWGPVGPHDRYVRAKFANHDQGSTFAGLEEEARIYTTIEVAEVKREFEALLDINLQIR